ncbi:hypothetical protein GBAR_LOCUS9871 [Geodia barretti]|uniref:Uncharacterized protein n=1 Tax=Geodia barretti TaxID=519541 RepID=A0AA35WJG7_GEOBA|nr:hypothetical protein GBAR_LOCUS9871 [Geodia barretti]
MMQGASDSDAPSPELADTMCDTAEFISRYQWVWDVQMTRLFQMKHWNRIPSEWWGPLLQLNTEQLNQLPFGFTEPSWPQSLRTFVAGSQRVCLERSVPDWVSAMAVPSGRSLCQEYDSKEDTMR